MTTFETIRKIAASIGYQLLQNDASTKEEYVLRQERSRWPDGIFQSLDEVVVYLMAQSQKT
ncbi:MULTISPECIES: hypothetical protein [unclassified Leptolyngbya]|uniref:hypothetical protein n=1 Tax=unclassified Leptolyngbya TaxID=2650499 RepID=UPI00168A2D24|nr:MULTISPECIES: hypothetical protein [unclassified Leptolyngbya]MBD1909782.1 hypothetical protein [Leptolyngbya sp. FACHB-8]MBD2157681.1 hypothetical protein [Leptolyngbya sp. FACHB-16]